MNFTFHQLKILHTVAHFQSITKAAEALLLTQPAVSLQLKKLQDQFPIPLTEVVGRKIYITDFGAEIVKAAQKILEEVEAINYQTHAFKNQLAGKLQISVASTGKYVMPYFLSGFMRLHKGVDLMMDVTIDVANHKVWFGDEFVACALKPGARDSFLKGTYDPLDELIEGAGEVAALAARLPYMQA